MERARLNMATDWALHFRTISNRKKTEPSAEFGSDFGGDFATPSDVLAYRKAWDPYVMGMARLEKQCSTMPDIDPTLASVHAGTADTIVTLWNQYAGYTPQQLLLQASDVLKGYQDSVLQAGKSVVGIRRDCPSLASKIPLPPTAVEQAQIQSRLEGMGVVAEGVINLLGVGANGALESLGHYAAIPVNVAKVLNKVAEHADSTTNKAAKLPGWLLTAGLGAVALVVVVPMAAPFIMPLLVAKRAAHR
jgi:hypothetical protein